MIAVLKNKKILYVVVGYIPLSVSLFFTPIYTYFLSIGDYGFVNLFNALIGVIAPLLHLGIKDGFSFLFWKSNGEKGEIQLLGNTITSMLTTQGVMLVTFIFLGKLILTPFLNFLSDENYSHFFHILIFHAFFLNINDVFFYFFRNTNKLSEFIKLNMYSTVLMTIGSVVGIIILKKGVDGAIYGRSIGYCSVVLYFLAKYYKFLSLDWKSFPKFFRSGIPVLLAGVLGTYSATLDKYYLQKYFDLKFMGIYGIALSIIYVIDILIISLFHYLLPETIKKIKDDKKQNILLPVRESFLVVLIFIFLVIAFSPLVLKLFPSPYSEALYYIPLLAINPILKFWYSFNTVNFYLKKNSLIFLKHQVLVFLLNFLAIFLIPIRLEIFGAIYLSILNSILLLAISFVLLHNSSDYVLKDKKMIFLTLFVLGLLFVLNFLYRKNTHPLNYALISLIGITALITIEFKLFVSFYQKSRKMFKSYDKN